MKHRVTGRFVRADETPIDGQVVADCGGKTFTTTLRNGGIPDSFKLSPGRYALSVVAAGETVWGPYHINIQRRWFGRRLFDLNHFVPGQD